MRLRMTTIPASCVAAEHKQLWRDLSVSPVPLVLYARAHPRNQLITFVCRGFNNGLDIYRQKHDKCKYSVGMVMIEEEEIGWNGT